MDDFYLNKGLGIDNWQLRNMWVTKLEMKASLNQISQLLKSFLSIYDAFMTRYGKEESKIWIFLINWISKISFLNAFIDFHKKHITSFKVV